MLYIYLSNYTKIVKIGSSDQERQDNFSGKGENTFIRKSMEILTLWTLTWHATVPTSNQHLSLLAFLLLSVRFLSFIVQLFSNSMKFLNKTHQENMPVKYIPPYTPLLYSKTGICRGIPIFLIFAPKHRLWVLVRTASPRRF